MPTDFDNINYVGFPAGGNKKIGCDKNYIGYCDGIIKEKEVKQVMTKPTYAKERGMKGGCRGRAICLKIFVVKEELLYGKITQKVKRRIYVSKRLVERS